MMASGLPQLYPPVKGDMRTENNVAIKIIKNNETFLFSDFFMIAFQDAWRKADRMSKVVPDKIMINCD
jgi:hypothetical protein